MFKKSAIALAALATLAAATTASAEGYFFAESQRQPAGLEVSLGDFNSPAAGEVAIYDYSGGTMGELLGTAKVTEGANSDVIVHFDHNVSVPVMAVLKTGDKVIGMEEIYLF